MFSIEFDDNWSFGKNPNEYFAFSLKRYHVKRWINGAESVYHVLHLIWLDTQVSCSFRPMLNVHPFVVIQSYAIALIWLDSIRFGSLQCTHTYKFLHRETQIMRKRFRVLPSLPSIFPLKINDFRCRHWIVDALCYSMSK